jgi:hypothetical protein
VTLQLKIHDLSAARHQPFRPLSLLEVYETVGSLLKRCEIYSLAENDSYTQGY